MQAAFGFTSWNIWIYSDPHSCFWHWDEHMVICLTEWTSHWRVVGFWPCPWLLFSLTVVWPTVCSWLHLPLPLDWLRAEDWNSLHFIFLPLKVQTTCCFQWKLWGAGGEHSSNSEFWHCPLLSCPASPPLPTPCRILEFSSWIAWTSRWSVSYPT